ncbi:hypothetical protein EC973_002709 [Apophysomyces ossiformis]|uniref:Uncharacterized protein n=1 Tax=Apophysomyces ossiformis TaxID=679940 RepID=A0A8H7EQZ4_9FUNG|nr:hypothetical protein EC973_002709 [Apophysomyces ossiformis]
MTPFEQDTSTENSNDSDFSDVLNSQSSVDEDRVQHYATMTLDQLSETWSLQCTRNRSTNVAPALKTTVSMSTKLGSSAKKPMAPQSSRLSRSLRQRRDIQLRPFTIESAQYRSLLGRKALDAMLAESEIPTQTTNGKYDEGEGSDDDTTYEFQPETQEIDTPSLETSLSSDIFDISSTFRPTSHNPSKPKKARAFLDNPSTSTRSRSTTHNITRVYGRKGKSRRIEPTAAAPLLSSFEQPQPRAFHAAALSGLNDSSADSHSEEEEDLATSSRSKKRKRKIVADSDEEDGADEPKQAAIVIEDDPWDGIADNVFDFPDDPSDDDKEVEATRPSSIGRSQLPSRPGNLIEKLKDKAGNTTDHTGPEGNKEDAFVVPDDGFDPNDAARKRVTLDELRKRKKALKGILPLSFSKVFSNQLQEEEQYREQRRKKATESSRQQGQRITHSSENQTKTGELTEKDVFSAFREESSESSDDEVMIIPSPTYIQPKITDMWNWEEPQEKSSDLRSNSREHGVKPKQKQKEGNARPRSRVESQSRSGCGSKAGNGSTRKSATRTGGKSKTTTGSRRTKASNSLRSREYNPYMSRQMMWDWSDVEDESPPAGRLPVKDASHPRNQMIWTADDSDGDYDELPTTAEPIANVSSSINPIVWHVDRSEEEEALHRRRLLPAVRFEQNELKRGTRLADGIYIQKGYLGQLLEQCPPRLMDRFFSFPFQLFSGWVQLNGCSVIQCQKEMECVFTQAFQYLANFWDDLSAATEKGSRDIQTFYSFVSACLTQWIPTVLEKERRELIELFRAEIARLCGRILVMSDGANDQLNPLETELPPKWKSLVELLLYSLDWSCRLQLLDPVESGHRWSVEHCARQLMWLLLWIGPQQAQVHNTEKEDMIVESKHPVVVEAWICLIHLLVSENQYIAYAEKDRFWKMLSHYLSLESTARAYPTVRDKSEWLRHWFVVLRPLYQFNCHGEAGEPLDSWTAFGKRFDELQNMGDDDLVALAQQEETEPKEIIV